MPCNKYTVFAIMVIFFVIIGIFAKYSMEKKEIIEIDNNEPMVSLDASGIISDDAPPEQLVTTAQFIAMLIKLLDKPLLEASQDENWYHAYIEAAVDREWISHGDFSLQNITQPITKLQAARIIVKVLEGRGEDTYPYPLDPYKEGFKNLNMLDRESVLYILKAYVKGILVLDSADDFHHASNISRKEAVQMVSRILNSKEREIPMWVAPEYRKELMIKSFNPPQGVYLAGESIEVGITILNTKKAEKEVWIGLSFQDQQGVWYDIPAEAVVLVPGEPLTHTMKWEVPREIMSGRYRTVMAVWDQSPNNKTATRLSHGELVDSLLIFSEQENFDFFDESSWIKSNIKLGRGKLQSKNISLSDSILKIHMPPNTLNGGELHTRELQGFGAYEIRMKVPDVPSSITGFFLYKPPDYYYEIDFEIYNQTDGVFFLTTYAHGDKKNEFFGTLPFDPTEDFNNYRIEYYLDKVEFYVNDVFITRWYEGFPREPMLLMVNSWYPDWLEGIPARENQYLYIDWIRY